VIEACGALPVTLVNFDARKDNNTNEQSRSLISWRTATEVNSDYFEIQHSLTSGKSWHKVGVVSAKSESTVIVDYSYVDNNPSNGNNLYRLKMVDKDGTFAFSRIVNLNFENIPELIAYPNPVVSDKLYIRQINSEESRKIEIFDINGNKMFQNDNGKNYTELDVKSYPAGLYMLHVTDTIGEVKVQKIIKQ
jgi:hypothetical protein